MITGRGLACQRDGQQILAGVDLAVEPGQTLAVTGPSGSGKTSLLSILAGLTPPDAGEVRIDGAPLTGFATPALGVSVVLQGYGLVSLQQRTALARALALQPRLLIADEPTAELDPAARTLALARMFEVAARGGALILATHDPEVAGRCGQVLDLRAQAG